MERPDFAIPVARNGYAWWYLDALSDDGRFGITVIAFIGSVFSPYYAQARRRAAAAGRTIDPEQYVAINTALYTPRGTLWSMTERSRRHLQRGNDHVQIGPSRWFWHNDALVVELDEISAPWPRPLTGRICLHPESMHGTAFPLAQAGGHVWQPFAPRARVSVNLSRPRLQWQGNGYLDGNGGHEPLGDAFVGWHWSRLAGESGSKIVYDLQPRGAPGWTMALQTNRHGRLEQVGTPGRVQLAPTGWRLDRRAPSGTMLTRTLLDTPFYARSTISGRLQDRRAHGVHETLSMERFRRGWVAWMLPFRMPRRS